MEKVILTVKENTPLTADVFRMVLQGDCSAVKTAGQFINIAIEGLYLRRPISVYDFSPDSVTVIYRVVGEGTEKMAQMKENCRLDVLCGLGNGYDTSKSGNKPLLIGGGCGCPPLYKLAKLLVEEGKRPSVVLGFNTAGDVILEKEFLSLGLPVTVTTADASYGVGGFVTDALPDEYTYFYTCGPEPMYKAINNATITSGQFSFEERMGCGFGACMGCSCETKYGSKRICKDGPVLEKEEIVW